MQRATSVRWLLLTSMCSIASQACGAGTTSGRVSGAGAGRGRGAGGGGRRAQPARAAAASRPASAASAALLAFALALVGAGRVLADAESPPPHLDLMPVVGSARVVTVEPGDTLLDIAWRNGVGFEGVQHLNPDVDAWIPDPGLAVNLPTEVILPQAPLEGLVLNIPEMRLFDFTVGAEPKIFPVAIGDSEDPTPVGHFEVGRKRSDPVWNVPVSIQSERPGLPTQVPPGPENPLGDRWMTLGRTSYGIHGTNIRWSIGRIATHGCVRLYNEDMREVYERVESGTPVSIVYQTVKIGVRDGDVYLEVHPDVYARGTTRPEHVLVELLVMSLTGKIDRASLQPEVVERELVRARGAPVRIARTPPPAQPQPDPD